MNCAATARPAAIAFFLQDLDGGGAERAIVALAGEISRRGHTVDLVLGDAAGAYRDEISAQVGVVDFGTRAPLHIFRGLVRYLRDRQPRAVMSALDVANIMLIPAARLAGYRGRAVISQRAVVAASLRDLGPVRRVATRVLQRLCFRHADALISNSHAAARDVRGMLGVPRERIVTIHNALDLERVERLARERLDDEFVRQARSELILSVGSLTKRKDMTTLVRAFGAVRAQREAKLVILGSGPERAALEALIAQLGLRDDVHLPGFDANPYKWMAAAAVFVSSSTEEGFPNVIAEALALRRPVVATDCPGDTAELLAHGKWGRLVPVGDAPRMAEAIRAALADAAVPDGRIRAAEFSPVHTASAYLDVLLKTS